MTIPTPRTVTITLDRNEAFIAWSMISTNVDILLKMDKTMAAIALDVIATKIQTAIEAAPEGAAID
jgi:hypothetical protein